MRPLLTILLGISSMAFSSELIRINEPSADRWMYSFNSTPGSRTAGSVFSALPAANSGVSDRFGQVLMRFPLASAGIPTLLGEGNYRVSRLILRATVYSHQGFRYDATADPWTSFGTAPTQADTDPGRPVELFGVGFRNGWTASTFQESSPHGSSTPGQRNAFALGFDAAANPRDVSDNVTQGFDPLPWSIGTCQLATGTLVPEETVMEFRVDLTRPGVRQYIHHAMNVGFIWLSLSSLQPAIQEGGEFADFHLKESAVHQFFGDFAPSLEIEYEIPHPTPTLTRHPQTNTVTLHWQALPSYTYVIQRSSDLSPNSWVNQHSITSPIVQNMQWQQTNTANRAFYRIIRTK